MHLRVRDGRRAGALALALLALAPASPARGGGAPRLVPRRGSAEGGEIVRIEGAGAASIRAVLFGESESPGVAPLPEGGLSVVVPPGEPGSRVVVRSGAEDGGRRLGRFRYAREAVRRATLSACGEVVFDGGGALLDVNLVLRSSARRLRGGAWAYDYRASNLTDGPVSVLWRSLEYAGFPGGWGIDLAPRGRARVRVTAPSGPAEVAAGATVLGAPGCAEASPDGDALVPAASLPPVPPVADLAFHAGGPGDGTLSWTHPDAGALDGFTVLLRQPGVHARRPRRFHLRADLLSLSVPGGLLEPGIQCFAVVPRKEGVPGPAALLAVAR